MVKIRPVKVATPGSEDVSRVEERKKKKRQDKKKSSSSKDKKRDKGRPSKKAVKRLGTPRSENYKSKYTDDAIATAIEAVKSKRLSIRAAAKEYGVPRTTIWRPYIWESPVKGWPPYSPF